MKSILSQRIQIHPQFQFIEWKRYFPHTFNMQISYQSFILRKSRSIPVVRLWTFEEWAYYYPIILFDPYKNRLEDNHVMDPLFVPDLQL
jgi:hypothetical protein